jgi:thiol-disulfide isomerase/thioredoxin
MTLEEFKGKTIFLNFWATWCPPCIAEMPNIQALYESVHSDSIEFVMVSLDEDHQKARDYLNRKEYNFPVYFLNGRKPGTYSSSVVPTTYVISPDGKIVTERRGMANYNTSGFKDFLRSF